MIWIITLLQVFYNKIIMLSYWKHFNEIENKFKTLELRVNTPVKQFKCKMCIRDRYYPLFQSLKYVTLSFEG